MTLTLDILLSLRRPSSNDDFVILRSTEDLRRGSRGRDYPAPRTRRRSPRRGRARPRNRRSRRAALDTASRRVTARNRNVAPRLARRHRLSLVRVPEQKSFVRLIEASLTQATSRRRHYATRDIDPSWRKMAARTVHTARDPSRPSPVVGKRRFRFRRRGVPALPTQRRWQARWAMSCSSASRRKSPAATVWSSG